MNNRPKERFSRIQFPKESILSQVGGLKQQRFILSQFWKPECEMGSLARPPWLSGRVRAHLFWLLVALGVENVCLSGWVSIQEEEENEWKM